jgi:hypothetical protein
MKTRSYFVVLFYLFVANVPFWLASYSMGLRLKGPFNDEYVLIGIVSLFVRRWVAVGLLVLAIGLDLLNGIASTYLLGIPEMIGSVGSLHEFAPSHVWSVVGVAICVVMVCVTAALVSGSAIAGSERRYAASFLGVFLIAAVACDVATGHVLAFRQDRQLGPVCLTRMGSHFVVMAGMHRKIAPYQFTAGTNDAAVAASANFERVSETQRMSAVLPNVVLILVESWGRPLDGDMEESLVRPYVDKGLAAKYTIERGTVPFYGPTVAGEARELCGSGIGFGLLTASRSELKSCLPMRMKAMGYRNTAVHGFTARMFSRGQWYGRIGFDEAWFRERLQGQGLPLCPGPFPGICDAAAAKWIGDRLERDSDSPQFIYWVTLNSHLPVPIPNHVEGAPSCSDVPGAREEPAVCSWYQLVFNVHRAAAEVALRATGRPTVFLIVGDHAPPFSAEKLRAQFSDEVVPYVLLKPKRDGVTAAGFLAVASQPTAAVPKSMRARGDLVEGGRGPGQ